MEHEYVLFGQPDWSVVLPLTADREVIAVKQFKQGCGRVVLELPAGTAETPKELPIEVARRELLEETGYRAGSVVALEPPQFMSTRNSWTRFHTFLAMSCERVASPHLDMTEDLTTVLIPFKEWVRLCEVELVEPSAIVTTFKSLSHLGYGTLQLPGSGP